MRGLSFREYLQFEDAIDYNALNLDDIISNHVSIASDIVSRIKVLPYFEKYLTSGYYPFYKEEGDGYLSRIQEVVSQTIDMDIPAVEDVEFGTLQKLKKLLMILAVNDVEDSGQGAETYFRSGKTVSRQHQYDVCLVRQCIGFLE